MKPALKCDEGQYCQVESGQTFGKCIQAECGPSLPACPTEKSLCQSGRCKACEGDGDCLALNPGGSGLYRWRLSGLP